MIDAIINFFTDNHIGLGISKFLMRFVSFKKLLDSSKVIDDINTIEQIKGLFDALLPKDDKAQQYSIAYLLLVKCPNNNEWEVTAINAKYKYLAKGVITVNLSNAANADSYYISFQ